MLQFVRTIVANPWARALVLKGLRALGFAASGALVALLIKHGVAAADAASVGAAVAALILGGGSAGMSWLDAKSVSRQVATAATVSARAVERGTATPDHIAESAEAGPAALARTIATLKAGQE